jgi:hypothetical protein
MTVVADDTEKALDERAPHFHHVNNSYGEWFVEDRALGLKEGFAPMSLDEFKASGTMQVMTPDAAIAMFKDLRARMPLDHYMMMLPPGLPAAKFQPYAKLFASKVMPAFR